jgi:Polyketide cyclase / dehydrase and lipid transport
MAAYHYVTTWRINAPIERVWEEVFHVERWPSWWKYMARVVELEPGAADGVGKRQQVLLRARLPSYTLGFEARTTRVQPPTALEAEATGGLEGTGRWTLAPDDGGTLVRYTWDVRTTGWWMNLLAPIARPIFATNHDYVMRNGARGLAELLGARLLAVD